MTAADLGDAFVFDPTVLEGIFEDLAPAGGRGAAPRPPRKRRRWRWRGTTSARGCWSWPPPSSRGPWPRRLARPAWRCCSATSSASAACTERRSNATARRAPPTRRTSAPSSARCGRSWPSTARTRRWPAPKGWPSWPRTTSRRWSPARASGSPPATRCARSTRCAKRRPARPAAPTSSSCRPGVSRRLGEREAALDAYQAALQLDSGLVQVWLELGTLEEERQNWTGARLAFQRALDLLPTYSEAARALARLLQPRSTRPGRPWRRSSRCSAPTRGTSRRSRCSGSCSSRTAGPTRPSRRSSGCLRFDPESPARRGSRTAPPWCGCAASARRPTSGSPSCAPIRGVPLAAAARNQLRSTRDLVHIFTATPE